LTKIKIPTVLSVRTINLSLNFDAQYEQNLVFQPENSYK